ncbi:hypothetical protein B4135_1803 [Caldibacillus debilis]|uniref:Uncharacterized protein n=1 Tax=Caldibacillus debilis TaxID=301148 RepID=A0A150M8U0_9BACI|nr:hypothetical protein B4135_1803 [Caldibacillus debilis]
MRQTAGFPCGHQTKMSPFHPVRLREKRAASPPGGPAKKRSVCQGGDFFWRKNRPHGKPLSLHPAGKVCPRPTGKDNIGHARGAILCNPRRLPKKRTAFPRRMPEKGRKLHRLFFMDRPTDGSADARARPCDFGSK